MKSVTEYFVLYFVSHLRWYELPAKCICVILMIVLWEISWYDCPYLTPKFCFKFVETSALFQGHHAQVLWVIPRSSFFSHWKSLMLEMFCSFSSELPTNSVVWNYFCKYIVRSKTCLSLIRVYLFFKFHYYHNLDTFRCQKYFYECIRYTFWHLRENKTSFLFRLCFILL